MTNKINIVVTTCGEPETYFLLQSLSKKIGNSDRYNLLCLKDSTRDIKVYDDLFDVDGVQFFLSPMNGDFSTFRNSIHTAIDVGDWVFFVDADETISNNMINNLPPVLDMNSGVGMFQLPRNNYVSGITDEYINMVGWRKDDFGRINYPDWQGRIYKYEDGVKWKNKVHEVLTGVSSYAKLRQKWAHLEHNKTFEKQKKQNKSYDEII